MPERHRDLEASIGTTCTANLSGTGNGDKTSAKSTVGFGSAGGGVRRKTVYFTVGQRKEVAVFEDQTPCEEIKSKPHIR